MIMILKKTTDCFLVKLQNKTCNKISHTFSRNKGDYLQDYNLEIKNDKLVLLIFSLRLYLHIFCVEVKKSSSYITLILRCLD